MPLQKILRIWVSVLALLTLASYKWPGFGAVILCSSIVLLGIINHLISIQSRKLGLITGGSASILAFATLAGFGLRPLEIAALTALAAIAGYGFAAMRVEMAESEGQHNDDVPSSKSKVGGGGTFDGGGASGNF